MRFFIIAVLSLLINHTKAQTKSIEGRVIDLYSRQPLQGAEVELIRKNAIANDDCLNYFYRKLFTSTGIPICSPDRSRIVFKTALSDKDGYFKFDDVDKTDYVICNYTVVRGRSSFRVYHDLETYHLDSAMIAENVAKGIYLIRGLCPYDQTKDLDSCPKCNLKTTVIPIIWGLPQYDMDGNFRDNNGRLIEDYYAGGCEPDWCRPMKYCKRCEHKF